MKYEGPSMDKESTFKRDFKGHSIHAESRIKPKINFVPHFPGRSNYGREFLNWGTVPYEKI